MVNQKNEYIRTARKKQRHEKESGFVDGHRFTLAVFAPAASMVQVPSPVAIAKKAVLVVHVFVRHVHYPSES